MILDTLHAPRTLPHSEECERAVLAAILLEGAPRATALADRLGPDDFYFERHQRIFAAALALAGAGDVVDLRTLQAALESRGHLDAVGGLAYLAGLDVDLPDLGGVDAYADVVRERALRRRLVQLGAELTRAALDGGLQAEEILTRTELELHGLAARALPTTTATFGQLVDGVLEQMEDDSPRKLIGTSTGWADVDRAILGLRPGNLLLVAGAPGAGKTSWAQQVAAHVASQTGIPAGIFSLEMTGLELTLRTLCEQADVSHSRLVQGYLSQRQWQTLIGTARRLRGIPVLIDDDATLTLPQLLSRARRWRAEHGVGLLVIDHLQLLTTGGRHQSRNDELTEISRSLKSLAKELELPIVLLAQQLLPARQGGGDKRPHLWDIRDSRAPAQDADVVLFIYRDELYNPDDHNVKGLAELLIRKNRNGAPGTVEMAFFGETFSFRQLARDRGHAGTTTDGWQKPPEIFTDHASPEATPAEKEPF